MHTKMLLFILRFGAPAFGAPHDEAIKEALKHCEADSFSAKLYAVHRFDVADEELNATYRKVMSSLAEEKSRERLKAAQRAWIQFRNADCAYEAVGAEGGSIYGHIVSDCKTRHTKRRIEDLSIFIECT